MSRKNINNTIEEDLYKKVQELALELSGKLKKKINANDLIEEGMQLLLEKYGKL